MYAVIYLRLLGVFVLNSKYLFKALFLIPSFKQSQNSQQSRSSSSLLRVKRLCHDAFADLVFRDEMPVESEARHRRRTCRARRLFIDWHCLNRISREIKQTRSSQQIQSRSPDLQHFQLCYQMHHMSLTPTFLLQSVIQLESETNQNA